MYNIICFIVYFYFNLFLELRTDKEYIQQAKVVFSYTGIYNLYKEDDIG